MTYEGVRLKILKYWRNGLAKQRKKQLSTTEFTIISNNCWGGMIYESYDIVKQSPTVGLFFMATDYIKFLSDLEGYIHGDLSFISPEQSRWKTEPELKNDKRFGTFPVGVISNGKESIEVFFLHFHSKEEARNKWNRRCERICWNKLLIKFNDQNGCTEEHVKLFAGLPYDNKIFFTVKQWTHQEDWKKAIKWYCYIKQKPSKEHIMASFEPFGKKITDIINTI